MTSLLASGREVLANPEALLFDKDGTLIDIHHYWTSMIRLRAQFVGDKWFPDQSTREAFIPRFMEALGVDLQLGRMKPEGPVGVKARPQVVAIGAACIREFDVSVNSEQVEDAFKEIDRKSAENLAPFLRVLPGVRTFLEEASRRGIKLDIVSTDIVSRSKVTLETLGLSKYFNGIFGGDSVPQTKPAPYLAEKAIAEGGYDRQRVAVIGDHPVDIRMGNAANIPCNIGVLTGLSAIDDFRGLSCVIVKDFRDLDFD